MTCRNYRWLPLLLLVHGQSAFPQPAHAISGPGACFSVGEVATRSLSGRRAKNPPVGRNAQRSHVDQVARKLGAQLAAEDAERIVDQVFYGPEISGQALGLDMAAECLKQNAFSVARGRTDVCFEVARYAREFALSKSFVPLDRRLQGIDKVVTDPLERKLTRELAHKVYESNVPFEASHGLAVEFYAECLAPSGTKP